MPTPAQVLTALNSADSAAPRITCYDDVPGPTAGERVELSGRVLGTWVSKAGNALQEEWDIEPGSVVRLALAPHWRLLYWAWAVWAVGGLVDLDGTEKADLVVTDDRDLLPTGPGVLVTRGALARSAGSPVPETIMDEAAELAAHGDELVVWQEPEADDPALLVDGTRHTYGGLLANVTGERPLPSGARAQLVDPSPGGLLRSALAAWSAGGSLVVHLGEPDEATLTRRAQSEGVTTG